MGSGCVGLLWGYGGYWLNGSEGVGGVPVLDYLVVREIEVFDN